MAGPQPPDPLEGALLLERYEVHARIGRGGTADVYRALDHRLGRWTCVKVMRASVAAEAKGARLEESFLDEARLLARLAHPSTVRIYDAGRAPESHLPFHVCELLDGGSLEQRVQGAGPYALEDACAVVARVAEALEEAHDSGIIHRDVKPSNLLFLRAGAVLVPKVADYGIAVETANIASREGATVHTLFTPRWAAPEQLRAEPVSPTTDVYALALVTMYMLTGRVPFDDEEVGSTFGWRAAGEGKLLARLSERGIGGDVQKVLAAGLQADPSSRTPSTMVFAERLRRALVTASPAHARPLPPPSVPAVDSLGRDDSSGRESRRASPSVDLLPADGAAFHVEPLGLAHGHGRRVETTDAVELRQLAGASELRLRVTLLPTFPLRMQVRGMTCFVRVPGGTLTSALTVDEAAGSGVIELVAATRQVIGTLSWSFGVGTAAGRVFEVQRERVVVGSGPSIQAVLLRLGRERDAIVLCRQDVTTR